MSKLSKLAMIRRSGPSHLPPAVATMAIHSAIRGPAEAVRRRRCCCCARRLLLLLLRLLLRRQLRCCAAAAAAAEVEAAGRPAEAARLARSSL
jgi:hypothetical protein